MPSESAEQQMRQLVGQGQTDSGTATGITPTTLQDTTKTWTVNQWIGLTATVGTRALVVTSNSVNTLTGTAWTPSQPAPGAYTIKGLLESIEAAYSNFHSVSHGDLVLEILLNKKMVSDKKGDAGSATGVSPTTLSDTTRTWTVNQWAGMNVEMNGSRLAVTSNTASVLTGASWSPTTPSAGIYQLGQVEEAAEETVHKGLTDSGTASAVGTASPGTLTDSTKNWVVNQWAQFTVTMGGDTLLIASNTATVLTGTLAWSPANPGAGAYSIVGAPHFPDPAKSEGVEQELLKNSLSGWA